MRVCLLTGGGYPYRRDALGGWCRTLVEGLDQVTFDLLTITDREPPPSRAYPLPGHVATARAVLVEPEPKRRGKPDPDAAVAADQLCRGMLGHRDQSFADGLRRLARSGAPLAGVPLADQLLDAWRAGRTSPADDRLPLPRLSVRDARTAATLLRHALRVLTVDVPAEADVVHCVGGSTPLLAALGGHWRSGRPLLITEARSAVTRSKPAEERLSPAVRTVLRRFRRSVARTGYAAAGLVAPLSAYHLGWAVRLGAEPSRVVQIPPGVDPALHPHVPETTAEPSLVWAGTGGPDSGLRPLLTAFAIVVAAVPGTVLHLAGVTAAHEDHAAELVDRSGLGRAVRLHPLPAQTGERYALGPIAVHLPGPSDPPYRLIEAMMSGRAVVALDIGSASETLGDTGVLVRPDDPEALAAACISLVRSPTRRRALGEAARRRALATFTTDRMVAGYRALYSDLADPPPAPAFALALAVPAPRAALPATMRWLTREDT
jgi:polysaccharide biosynthesis protein PelF